MKATLLLLLCLAIHCVMQPSRARSDSGEPAWSEEQRDRFEQFVLRQGTNIEIVQGFENEAINEIVRRLKADKTGLRPLGLLWTLEHSLPKLKSLSNATRSAAMNAIYDCLSSPNYWNRSDAVDMVAGIEGKDGLKKVLPLLEDGYDDVRSSVISAFKQFGDEQDAEQLRLALERRKKKLSPEAAAKDFSLAYGYEVVNKIKHPSATNDEPTQNPHR